MPEDPSELYRRRLSEREAGVRLLTASDARIAYSRLAVAGLGGILLIGAWTARLSWFWLVVPVVMFAGLAWYHAKVLRRREVAARGVRFYARGLARMNDRWDTDGETGERFLDDTHLFANDLDLFGPSSLFQLLSSARTRGGEATLAGWLVAPAQRAVIEARGEAVRELAPHIDLRESLWSAGTDVGAAVDDDSLKTWAAEPRTLPGRPLQAIATGLTACALAAAVWWALGGGPVLLLVVLAVEALVSLPLRRRVQKALHAASEPARELDVLAEVLERLEQGTFQSPRLTALKERVTRSHGTASISIRALHRLVELHDWQHNQFFAPVAAALLWGTHVAWAIERWREQHGSDVRTWLDATGELEALTSLAAYHFEHPDDVWPTIIDSEGAPVLEGIGLGHPLLPADRMVRNDVHMGRETRLLLVSGSNMSGKSTLLRTVGVNVVLALCGSPVRASALSVSPVALGATLRIQDSLQEGRSRFYAEIVRIRALAALADKSPPLLFLLDELFHGTNSHDRLAGSIGVLQSLLAKHAIGLVTTHDLAMTQAADALGSHVVNIHFEDQFKDGEIVFDYRVKPGPVQRSNALALMRAVGLQIDDPPLPKAPTV